MKKFKIIFFVIFVTTFFYSCSTMKKGFESQRKNSTDEFLIEKKQPLVMPPDFEELPVPGNENQEQKNNENLEIKSLITGSDNKSSKSQNSSNQDTNFENSILEKIKNN